MKPEIKKLAQAYQPVIFVFLAFLTMVLVSYFYVSDIVQRQMQMLGEETMDTIETAVSGSLAEAELIFANTAQSVEELLSKGRGNDDILEYLVESNKYFNMQRSPLPDFMKTYAYIRGEFLDGSGWVPPEGYYPPSRPWYIGASGLGGEIFFSEPYIDAETGGMCISFSKELRSNSGECFGILAIDLKLNRITDYMAVQNISNSGYGVLLSDTMHFTAHRDPELTGMLMSDAGSGYARLADMLGQNIPCSAERFTDRDGVDSIAFFRRIFVGWHIGVIIPRAQYYAQVYTLAYVLGLLGLTLMVALSYILVKTRVAKMRSDEENLSKSNFLARMSHEMRTPMNAIIGMTRIARMSGDPKKVQDSLIKIDSAAAHLLGVINDVLDMSKIEAGKLDISLSDFSFKRMIDQVTVVSGIKMEEKGQNFTIAIDDDVPPCIISDRQRLAQVVTNLLSNATKFTPQGGDIGLSVQLIGRDRDMCHLRFTVSDTGIGISKEQQDRLFSSFEQADGSISRKFGGTGLGLAISKRIIEMMAGTVWIESELGQGARFIFTIRAAVGTGADDIDGFETESTIVTDGLFGGKRILLAEDVEINREVLLSMFEGTGAEFVCAGDGGQAVRLFCEAPERFDLIFMDIHMPEVDGYEAARSIRALNIPAAKSVPIIAMTANVFREDIEKCLAAGMNGHIGKPIEIDELMETTKRYLLRVL